MKPRSILAFVGFAGATALAAVLGGRVTRNNKRWYRSLRKPAFQPPDAAFGPVWTGLYALLSVSAWRVWRTPPSAARTRALGWWSGQLVLNAAWSPLFFGAHRPRLALADQALLLGAIGAYANQARKVDRPAAWMMLPYAAWCGFAAVLNEEIIRRN